MAKGGSHTGWRVEGGKEAGVRVGSDRSKEEENTHTQRELRELRGGEESKGRMCIMENSNGLNLTS